jgi:ribosomal protein S4E
MDLREIGSGVMDWINLAQDRYHWRVLVNTVMNLRVHRILGISSVVEWLVVS